MESAGSANKPADHLETFVTYKGNPFLCMDGSLLCMGVAIVIFGGWFSVFYDPDAFSLTGLGVIFFILSVNRFYYFSCSENDFVVQNHFMFWIRKTYSFSTLNQIAFEMPYRMPGCIRLITKELKNSRFPAGSVSDSQWIALKEQLEKQNVPIHDEFVDSIVLCEFVLFDEIKEIFSRFKKNER